MSRVWPCWMPCSRRSCWRRSSLPLMSSSMAVGSLNVAMLLQPLDDLHAQHLQQPLAGLKPSTLLQPVAEAFQHFTSVFDDINGAAHDRAADQTVEYAQVRRRRHRHHRVGSMTCWLLSRRSSRTSAPSGPQSCCSRWSPTSRRLESELDRFKPSVLFQPASGTGGAAAAVSGECAAAAHRCAVSRCSRRPCKSSTACGPRP